jgi:uncharacterized protein (TIRG00374 family)
VQTKLTEQTLENLAPSPGRKLIAFGRRWGWGSLGLILTLGTLYWLVKNLDLDQVLVGLGAADYRWVIAGLGAVLLTLIARVLRWQVLLYSGPVTFAGTLRAVVLGQLLNLILPARLGDVGRAYLISQDGKTYQAQALGTIALEKLWDLVILIALIAGLSFWQPLPAWIIVPARLTVAAGAMVLVGIISVLYFRPVLAERLNLLIHWFRLSNGRWSSPLLGRMLDGLGGLRRPRVMLIAAGWSLIAWLFGAVTNVALLKAFGLPPEAGIAILLLVVLQMGVALPAVPGHIGVFEALCLATLSLFGIEANVALGYGVTLHAVVLTPPILLGLWWFLRLGAPSRRTIWRLT